MSETLSGGSNTKINLTAYLLWKDSEGLEMCWKGNDFMVPSDYSAAGSGSNPGPEIFTLQHKGPCG